MVKIAIVTGANKGIGFEIAKQIASSGVKTILACRSETLGKEAETKLKQLALDVEFRQLDTSNNESIDAFAASFRADFGALDILVNNAAIAQASANGVQLPYNQSARPVLTTNYYGVLRLSDALLPLLREASHPRLVNVASGLGHLHNLNSDEDRAAYSTESLTIEQLNQFVEKFISDTENDIPTIQEGLAKRNYPGIYAIYTYSKIALIAATKIYARNPANARVLINASCPGYCSTDLNGHTGTRSPEEGAKTPVLLALLPANSTVNGRFYENEADSEW